MDSEGLQSFNSFGDLSRHFKARAKQKDVQHALELFSEGNALEAAELLDNYNLSEETPADQVTYGQCYAEAAKMIIRQGDLKASQDYLKKAISLGYGRWHVQYRLKLIHQVLRNELQTEPDADWIEHYTFSCSDCGYTEPTPLVCAKCVGVLRFPVKPIYNDELSGLYSLGVYRWRGDPESYNPLSRMIRLMKRNEGKKICEYLAYLLVQALEEETDFLSKADMSISVPADPERAKERGFDNIAELTIGMEVYSLVPRASGVLLKVKSTQDLRSLSPRERKIALEGSIIVDTHKQHLVADATILLVDDVVTYGTTLNLCAEILKSAGARQVLGATLARSESSRVTERLSDGDQ
jgi:predicted amidophosphoribosyltransferase